MSMLLLLCVLTCRCEFRGWHSEQTNAHTCTYNKWLVCSYDSYAKQGLDDALSQPVEGPRQRKAPEALNR